MKRPSAVTVLFLVASAGILSWIGLNNGYSAEPPVPNPSSYYSQLAESFRKGEIAMGFKPDPGVTKLKNPYAWTQYHAYHVPIDVSYYGGNYFIYWGAAPVLTFVLPYYWVAHRYPSSNVQAVWFAFLAVAFFFLSGLRWIERKQGRRPSLVQELALGACILFATLIPAVLAKTEIYEVAILAGLAFCALAGYLALFRARGAAFTSGLFAGLAFASRPVDALVLVPLIALVTTDGKIFPASAWRRLVPLVAGFSLVFMLSLLYNYARFENCFEFGLFLQLTPIQMREWSWDLRNVVIGAAASLLSPFKLLSHFPFALPERFGEGWLIPRHRFLHDVTVGTWLVAPMVPFAFFRCLRRARDPVPLAYFAFAVALLILEANAGINVRYTMESGTLFVFASALYLLTRPRASFGSSLLAGTAVLFSVVIGAAVAISFNAPRFRSPLPPRNEKAVSRQDHGSNLNFAADLGCGGR